MFVVLSVPAEEADKVGGNSSCEETMALTENCRCIVVRSTVGSQVLQQCTTGPERSRLCGDGLLPSAWIVQLTLPMWIGVCASVTQSFAVRNPAKSISCKLLRAKRSRGPCEPNGYVQMCGHKGMRMESY